MSKLTKAVCDFCAGPLGKKHATLTVPVLKMDGTPDKDKPTDPYVASVLSLMTYGTGPGAGGGKTRAFDMCIDCAIGLTKWRHAAIEKLIESGFVKE